MVPSPSMTNKLAIVGLVILLLVLAIPLGIGMAMAPCPECSTPAASGMALCLVILIGVALFVSSFVSSLELERRRPRGLLLASMYERPPRSA